jgi:hypothetical protein
MTDAAYWLAVCDARRASCPDGFQMLVRDQWCLRFLCGVAEGKPTACGLDGWLWTFADHSQLLANSQVTMTTGDKR